MIVLCGEAYRATEHYFPDASIKDVYINFPDPWPKTRHAKHRLIRDEFADQLARILEDGQSLTFVTDDPPYSEWVIDVMNRHRNFTSTYPEPFYVTEGPGYGSSYFEDLWRSQGRVIRYHCFQKGSEKNG